MATRSYLINPYNQILNNYKGEPAFLEDISKAREKELHFHTDIDDYFATLATILSLFSQENNKHTPGRTKALKTIVEDLLYLQKNYSIVKKLNSLKR